uniref:Leprecan-like alpha-helical domain-containing protein n=1 Tax=Mola mola TaxID=94237 RepID=A0A3Q3X8L6_MOLML
MEASGAQGDGLSSLLFMTAAQYDNYSLPNFPREDVMPLSAAWTESTRYLELSLRLHRLLRDSGRYCALLCDRGQHGGPISPSCRQILQALRRRAPYRYLHFAYSKLKDLQRAVPCAYTFLQKNPDDQEMHRLMDEYKSQYDLSGYLTDLEEQPHELISSADYSSGVEHLESALRLYLQEYDLCQADCEGIVQLSPDSSFYAAVAVNDGRSAVPCAYSYFLLEPKDPVMEQNLLYYKAYSEQWGLQSDHFTARTEAVKYHNRTVAHRQMQMPSEEYSQMGDEVRLNTCSWKHPRFAKYFNTKKPLLT